MNTGIDQLVDTFKGTPQPLEAKVQRDNKGQPPGAVPKDLQEVIALQEIAKIRQGVQNQQAMQAGGAQPSVAEKLRQIVGAMRAQGQPQVAGAMPQQTVMAAGGGSLDQLISNLGRHYAGDGIIAFNGAKGSEVPTEAELEAQRKSDREKIKAATGMLGEGGVRSVAALADILTMIPRGLAGATDTAIIRPLRALGANVGYISPELTPGNQSSDTMTPFYDRYIRAREQGENPSEVKPTSTPSPTDPNFRRQTDPRMLGVSPVADDVPLITPASNSKPSVNVPGNKPNVNKPNVNTTKLVEEEMDPMEVALRAAIMKGMGRDADTEFEKGAKRHEQFMGLDKLLQPREARIAEREGMLRKIQGERLPDWVAGLDRASKPILSGGLGTLINQYGTGKEEQKKAYDTEDLKFFDQISDMKDEVVKLKMEGKYKAAAAGEAAIKEMLADRRQAESSGTSLLNTKAINKSREQTALEGRLSREAMAAQSAQARRDAQKEKSDYQLEKLKQGERALNLKIAQAGISAQRPTIDAAAKEAKMYRIVYEGLKDKDPEKAAGALAKAEEAQHRIDMILAPLAGIAGSSVAAAPTGKPAPSTGGAKFLGFEPSKS